MSHHHDKSESDVDVDAVESDEQRDATRLGEAMDALMSGRSALDDLPVPEDGDDLADWVALSQAVRGAGPTGELSESRRQAVWGEIQGRLDRAVDAAQTRSKARAKARWAWLGGAFAALAAAVIAVVFVSQSFLADQPAAVDPPPAPRAVAAADAAAATYAMQVMAPGAEPRGDTRLRDYRRARFAAYRTDATHQRRFRSGGDR